MIARIALKLQGALQAPQWTMPATGHLHEAPGRPREAPVQVILTLWMLEIAHRNAQACCTALLRHPTAMPPKSKRTRTASAAKPASEAGEVQGMAAGPSKKKNRSRAAGGADGGSGGGAPAEQQQEQQPEKKRGKRQRKEMGIPQPDVVCFSRQQTGVRVGTSGYSYAHWRDNYYQGLPQRLEWDVHCREFDMLEINATFYGWQKPAVFDSWRERAAAARPTFEYVVKAQQFYTHRKRLNVDVAFIESWGRFWDNCRRLRPHLGPVLFQFPASFKTTSGKGEAATSNIDRLRRLGEVLDPAGRFVFEFRDASWFCQEVYDVMRQHDWCLAITHLTDVPRGGKLSKEEGGWIGSLTPGPNPRPEEYPLDCCTWGVYVRFHGSTGQYQGAHGAAELRLWADRAKAWLAGDRKVWFAFNNDTVPPGAKLPSAISDCRDLAAALRANGAWPD